MRYDVRVILRKLKEKVYEPQTPYRVPLQSVYIEKLISECLDGVVEIRVPLPIPGEGLAVQC